MLDDGFLVTKTSDASLSLAHVEKRRFDQSDRGVIIPVTDEILHVLPVVRLLR